MTIVTCRGMTKQSVKETGFNNIPAQSYDYSLPINHTCPKDWKNSKVILNEDELEKDELDQLKKMYEISTNFVNNINKNQLKDAIKDVYDFGEVINIKNKTYDQWKYEWKKKLNCKVPGYKSTLDLLILILRLHKMLYKNQQKNNYDNILDENNINDIIKRLPNILV